MMRMLRATAKSIDVIDDSGWCPRCGGELRSLESGVGCLGKQLRYVAPPILVLRCLQCGYSERFCVC